MEIVRRIGSVLPVQLHCAARLGAGGTGESNTLPFLPAGFVLPGMHVFLADGGYDVVESVERVTVDRPLYDLDVGTRTTSLPTSRDAQQHLRFRGADIRNILEFEDAFPDAHVVKLEQNLSSARSSPPRMRWSHTTGAARARRCGPTSARGSGAGAGLGDEHAEARFVAAEVQRMVDEGVSRSEIAVFYRTNAQSRVLEDMLVRAQIGYQVIGGTVLRPRRDQGRDRLPHLHGSTRRTPARSRGSRTRPSAGSGRRRCRGC